MYLLVEFLVDCFGCSDDLLGLIELIGLVVFDVFLFGDMFECIFVVSLVFVIGVVLVKYWSL